ncbi:hypothetical protein Hanom_Chr07g00592951 [Helianthus anomalus]
MIYIRIKKKSFRSKQARESKCTMHCLLKTAFGKLQKVNLLMMGEHTKLFVLNCYIYKFCMILKLPISHRDYRYLKYRSLTDIRFLPH